MTVTATALFTPTIALLATLHSLVAARNALHYALEAAGRLGALSEPFALRGRPGRPVLPIYRYVRSWKINKTDTNNHKWSSRPNTIPL